MYNIAGEDEISDRTFLEAVEFNYRRIGFERALRGRFENAQRLLPDLARDALASAERRRTTEWNRVFGTLGFLNVAWLLLLRRALRRERSDDGARRLYILTAVSIAIPVLVLFGSGEATAHTASYAAIATMFVLAAHEARVLPRAAILALLALQAALFVVDWIALTPPRPPASAIPVASAPLALIALISGVAFIIMTARLGRQALDATIPERDSAYS
jgi:hypothetical protein